MIAVILLLKRMIFKQVISLCRVHDMIKALFGGDIFVWLDFTLGSNFIQKVWEEKDLLCSVCKQMMIGRLRLSLFGRIS